MLSICAARSSVCLVSCFLTSSPRRCISLAMSVPWTTLKFPSLSETSMFLPAPKTAGFRSNISLFTDRRTKRCAMIARRSAHRHSRPSHRETMTFDFIFFEYIFSCEGWYLSIPNQWSLAKRVTHRRTSRVVPHAYLTVVPHASYLTRTVVPHLHTPSGPILPPVPPTLWTRQLFSVSPHIAQPSIAIRRMQSCSSWTRCAGSSNRIWLASTASKVRRQATTASLHPCAL